MAEATSSTLWSSLYYLYMAIALVVGALVLGWLFYSLWRFRARPGAPRPADAPVAGAIPPERGHPLWSYVMAALIALIMFGLAFGTISAVETLENPPETGERIHVEVVGFQFGWKYTLTGEGGVPVQITPPAESSRETAFRVPVGVPVVMNVTSQDVWHNFAIPDYRIRVDAIPGTINLLWFNATTTTGTEAGDGVRHVCVQLCGLNHAAMHTRVLVVPRAEFDAWLKEQSADAYARAASRIFRNPGEGAYVNGTIGADGLTLAAAGFIPGKPLVLNLTNEDAAERVATVQAGDVTRSVTIPAGAAGRLYVVAPASGEVAVASGDDRATLTAVTP